MKDPYGMYHGNIDDYLESTAGPDHFYNSKSDPLYYHYKTEYEYISQTDRAYLLKVPGGEPFFCAKSLWKKAKISNGTISGYLWKGFSSKPIKKGNKDE